MMVRMQYLPPTNRINATDKKTKLFILNNFRSRPVVTHPEKNVRNSPEVVRTTSQYQWIFQSRPL